MRTSLEWAHHTSRPPVLCARARAHPPACTLFVDLLLRASCFSLLASGGGSDRWSLISVVAGCPCGKISDRCLSGSGARAPDPISTPIPPESDTTPTPQADTQIARNFTPSRPRLDPQTSHRLASRPTETSTLNRPPKRSHIDPRPTPNRRPTEPTTVPHTDPELAPQRCPPPTPRPTPALSTYGPSPGPGSAHMGQRRGLGQQARQRRRRSHFEHKSTHPNFRVVAGGLGRDASSGVFAHGAAAQ